MYYPSAKFGGDVCPVSRYTYTHVISTEPLNARGLLPHSTHVGMSKERQIAARIKMKKADSK